MPKFRSLIALLIALTFVPIASAELPTADAILKIHRENRAKLTRLHLQLVQTEEATDAWAVHFRDSRQNESAFADACAQMLESKLEEMEIQFDGKTLKGEEAKALLTEIVESHKQTARRQDRRQEWKAFQMFTPMEFFLNGDEYQFRESQSHFQTVADLAAWKFQDTPLTPETLAADYRKTTIFSRSHEINPPSRWWSCGSVCNAYIMQKHLCDVSHVLLPPFTEVTGTRWDSRHTYDHFFSQPTKKYRVIRQDVVDGRELTVVDVEVPIGEASEGLLCYRAWLDLKRGATPMKVFHSQSVSGRFIPGRFDWSAPSEITVTHEQRELANGAYYPAKVVMEQWDTDPAAPQLAEEDIRAGKAPRVVHRRRTWECSLVEADIQFKPGFFVLPFSPDEKVFDHDAEKMIGELERQPVATIGQQAPPLTIARWLDGEQRTLDGLKGHVVVLDFWGLWCSACRNDVASKKAIQENFAGQPVVFIAIHSAESKIDQVESRIREFQKEKGWQYISAIDSGRMVEDSVTTTAYGVDHFPFLVVIGPDGKIVYSDPAADGPACDEKDPVIMAAFEKTFNDYWELRFKSVGETWPLNESLDEKAQEEIYERVNQKYIIHLIESAIPKK